MTTAQCKQQPEIIQFDSNLVAVPISISQVEVGPPDAGESIYQYEHILVQLSIPVHPEDIDCVKSYLMDAIKAKHESAIAEGYLTSFGFRVDIMQQNVTDWSAALQLIQLSGAENIEICDYDNQLHTLTTIQYTQMCGEIGLYLSQLRSKKWAIREAIIASETITDAYVAAIWT